MTKEWPRLLTPIVGVNNRHKSAIDTDSVSTIATNRLLTPTNDSFHLLSADASTRYAHSGRSLRWFSADQTSRSATAYISADSNTGSVLMRFTMVCRNIRGVYDANVLSLTAYCLAVPTPALKCFALGFLTETTSEPEMFT